MMKIAFVNCRTMPGGVLNVLQDLLLSQLRKYWSSAEIRIFTLVSEFEQLELPIPWNPEQIVKIPVTTALPRWLNQLFLFFKKRQTPILSKLMDYRNLIVCYPELMKYLSSKLKKRKPDQIEISSFAIAKNIDPIPQVPIHLYLHSPMQYIWSHYEEYVGKFSGWKRKLFELLAQRLRKRDLKHTTFDHVVCNSHYTQHLAKEIYNIESIVRYPKIKDEYRTAGISARPKPYLVCVGRLVNFVRECGLIIRACSQAGIPLVMIGDGPDANYLKSIAGERVIFTGRMQEEFADTIKHSSGLINLTKESFGIGTVEALLMGVPVLGYAQGATPELVDQQSGILISEKNEATLIETLQVFLQKKWNRKLISNTIREKLLK